MENMEENIVVLSDDEGNEIQFEFLDMIEYDSKEYAILLPLDEDQVVILELESTDEEQENFVTVDDVAVLEAVFELFKEKYKDEFNFVD